MMELVETLLPWMIVLLFGATAVVAWAFLHRLKTRHRTVWEELGEPMLIWNQTFQNSRKLSRSGRQLRSLGDPTLRRLQWAERLLGTACVIALLLWLWLR